MPFMMPSMSATLVLIVPIFLIDDSDRVIDTELFLIALAFIVVVFASAPPFPAGKSFCAVIAISLYTHQLFLR